MAEKFVTPVFHSPATHDPIISVSSTPPPNLPSGAEYDISTVTSVSLIGDDTGQTQCQKATPTAMVMGFFCCVVVFGPLALLVYSWKDDQNISAKMMFITVAVGIFIVVCCVVLVCFCAMEESLCAVGKRVDKRVLIKRRESTESLLSDPHNKKEEGKGTTSPSGEIGDIEMQRPMTFTIDSGEEGKGAKND